MKGFDAVYKMYLFPHRVQEQIHFGTPPFRFGSKENIDLPWNFAPV